MGKTPWPSFLLVAALAAGMTWRLSRRPPPSASEFVSGLAVLQPDLRLVVARADLVETLSGENGKELFGLDLGTTKAVVTMPARVHYAVDLRGERPVDFRFEREAGRLTVTFPVPEVQAVEVLAGGEKSVIEPGWGRLRELSGHALQETLERGAYEAVRRDAARPASLAAARAQARPALTRLIVAYLERAGLWRGLGGVSELRVVFRGEESEGLVAAAR